MANLATFDNLATGKFALNMVMMSIHRKGTKKLADQRRNNGDWKSGSKVMAKTRIWEFLLM